MLPISEKGCVVLCCLKCVLTMFSEGPEDAKNERSTAVMSAAIVERQKYIKTKNYIHTVKIYQKKMQCGRVWGINFIFCFEFVNNKNEQEVWCASHELYFVFEIICKCGAGIMTYQITETMSKRTIFWFDAQKFRAQSCTYVKICILAFFICFLFVLTKQ